MNDLPNEALERRMLDLVRRTPFPPTPDLARKVTRRLEHHPAPTLILARVALYILIILVGLTLAVPEIRAAVFAALRIGAVTLEREAPTPDSKTDTLATILALEGRTTLEAAQDALPFDILLPSYPDDLGQPDAVYQPTPASVVLIWLDGEQVRLVVTEHSSTEPFAKYYPWIEERTTVGGVEAFWLEEPHLIFSEGGDAVTRRIVNDHVLIWQSGAQTYRIETDLPLDEARRIAESITGTDTPPPVYSFRN